MLSKIKKFITLDFSKKRLLCEAYFFLAWGRILKSVPFSRVAPSLGYSFHETPIQQVNNDKIVRDISYAVQSMSRYTFWESACLVQAIAAIRMLNRRKIKTTLYLGTTKDKNGKMIAHAWVRCGTIYVTGGDVKDHFTIVNSFANGE